MLPNLLIINVLTALSYPIGTPCLIKLIRLSDVPFAEYCVILSLEIKNTARFKVICSGMAV